MILALVPAFNEEDRIQKVVQSLLSFVDYVVVIDDGSTDDTAGIARRAGAIVLVHEINRGQGAALETGHAYARKIDADVVVHFDGDGQFDPRDIPGAIAQLRNCSVDMIFGSRFLDDRSAVPWFKRYVLLPIAKVVNYLFAPLPLSDVHNGFRILSKKAFTTIKISQDGMAHATEIPMLVKQHALRYSEYPVKVTYHEYGQGVPGGLAIVKDLLIGRFLK